MIFIDDIFYKLGEKANLKRSFDEAKQKIAHFEEKTSVQQKEAEEMRGNLREVEKARQEARREIQQLHNQVRFYDLTHVYCES